MIFVYSVSCFILTCYVSFPFSVSLVDEMLRLVLVFPWFVADVDVLASYFVFSFPQRFVFNPPAFGHPDVSFWFQTCPYLISSDIK